MFEHEQATLGAPEFNTLDEPIKETILRDLGAVASKFYHVLYPKSVSACVLRNSNEIAGRRRVCWKSGTCGAHSYFAHWWQPSSRSWPQFCQKSFSNFVYLQGHSTEDSKGDGGPEFAEVFVIVWVRTANFVHIIFALCLFWLSSRLGQWL